MNYTRGEKNPSKILSVRFVSLTTKKGVKKRMSVTMLMKDASSFNTIGIGSGKSANMTDAIKSAETNCYKNLFKIPVNRSKTIPYGVEGEFCGVKIRLKPKNSGLKAGGVAKQILSFAGIESASCKCLGKSRSKLNIIKALIICLKKLQSIRKVAIRSNTTIDAIKARSA